MNSWLCKRCNLNTSADHEPKDCISALRKRVNDLEGPQNLWIGSALDAMSTSQREELLSRHGYHHAGRCKERYALSAHAVEVADKLAQSNPITERLELLKAGPNDTVILRTQYELSESSIKNLREEWQRAVGKDRKLTIIHGFECDVSTWKVDAPSMEICFPVVRKDGQLSTVRIGDWFKLPEGVGRLESAEMFHVPHNFLGADDRTGFKCRFFLQNRADKLEVAMPSLSDLEPA